MTEPSPRHDAEAPLVTRREVIAYGTVGAMLTLLVVASCVEKWNSTMFYFGALLAGSYAGWGAAVVGARRAKRIGDKSGYVVLNALVAICAIPLGCMGISLLTWFLIFVGWLMR